MARALGGRAARAAQATRCDWMLREKDALEQLEHPFVVDLFGTYADGDSVYFLFEFAQGGELLRIMEKLERLEEKTATFYAGCLVLALAHIHALEYVYRDLKPENVLVDCFGYVKLCDFGFAKKVVDRTYTRCGTPDYVAPEMLLGQGVNQACDWWALGVLLHEMLAGVTPFSDPDGVEMKTFSNILNAQSPKVAAAVAEQQEGFSASARAMLGGLLTTKIASRLGYMQRGADEVIEHPWFAALDFDALLNRTVEPPWRPKISAADDTLFFDQEEQQESFDSLAEQAAKPLDGLDEEARANWEHVVDEFS